MMKAFDSIDGQEAAMNPFIAASCPGDHSFALTGVKE